MTGVLQLGLATLAAWLAAQCLLTLWHGPAPLPLTAPARTVPPLDLLTEHWTPRTAPVSDEIPVTGLPLTWVGGLKAEPLQATVVVLGYREQQHTLTEGQSLAPGIVLRRIDERGLIFEHNGRLERLPWPAERPLQGLKRHG
ncbi:pilus assembly protein PilZ [Stutzerimonas nosocomialis]|uniref:pilus assembly protein PilZ n=1 Tax=Stutzerimonas nosocomialis TaxID=1056496 RepID=UPI001108FF31|nr:pilus assembly protein PilZ [Stutzerimonas nosocomialis]TLX54564.1 pilus assembly protein PilZ [Stutzerimonas nosocomialis]TLX61332.1 pilus assembly protein PilZ [Stutzerimonas nosocomialis]